MKASQKLIDAIKRFEGVRLQAYQDSVGVWTIGYGHTKDVKKGDRITQYQAEQLLKEDLAQFEAMANKVRGLNTQGKYDAVVDFLYNCGPGNFNSSTLKKYIEYYNNDRIKLRLKGMSPVQYRTHNAVLS